MGRTRLLRARQKSPQARPRGQQDTRRPDLRQARRIAAVAGCRTVHSWGGRLLCIRETSTHRRYERPTSPRESLRREGRLEAGGAVGAEERATSLALQSGADGAWCAGLYREKTEMP